MKQPAIQSNRFSKPVAMIMLGVASLALMACGGSGELIGGAEQTGSTTKEAEPSGPVEVVTGQVPADAAKQMAALAEPLFPLAVEAGDESANPAYSPLSVYLALAMTANGASGVSADQFAALLGGSPDQVNALAAGIMTEYITTGEGPILSLANSLWLDDSFTVNPDFEQQTRAIFRAEVATLDLQTEGKERINQWVDQKTNNLIDQIIERVSEYAVAFLVNALYFKGEWATQFEDYATSNSSFTLADGTDVSVPTMYADDLYVPYFNSEIGEGIVLPYVGDRFGMLLVMPADGVDQVTWDGNQLATWLAAGEQFGGIDLYLPKWESEFSVTLNQPLKDLGLVAPFGIGGDLAGIGTAAAGAGLAISQVAHKTVVKVDEAGTEAAAVTSVGIDAMSAPLEPVIVRFDRPFVYAIVDLDTGVPLFLGQVNNPAA